MKCGYQSLTFDNFMDLSLSIPNKMSMSSLGVADCLKNFVASERMEKCGYKCSKCKAVDKMEKDITVYRFPKILVIHLKRFSRREKLTTMVTVPKKLDMSVYGPYSSKFPFSFFISANISVYLSKSIWQTPIGLINLLSYFNSQISLSLWSTY